MTDEPNTPLHALAATAARWRDPEYDPRASAVQATLDAPNRWTEEGLAHVINRRMQSITAEALEEWLGERAAESAPTIAVLFGSAGPLDGFRMALAAWGHGYATACALPDGSPALVRAFAKDLSEALPGLDVSFAEPAEALATADRVLARPAGDDAADTIRAMCEQHGVPPSDRLLQGPVYSVGVVDGHETDDERERLAEDMLLLDGTGRRRLAVVWAPQGLAPDTYLESMAHFRGLYPAHPDTPGTLQMQQAFLEAQDQSHAYAEDLQFLVSRGDPAPQKPAHIRWAEYEERDEVGAWLREQDDDVCALIARRHLHDQLDVDVPLRTPGGGQVPPLDDPEGRAIAQFLAPDA